jgi:hypothetical protein
MAFPSLVRRREAQAAAAELEATRKQLSQSQASTCVGRAVVQPWVQMLGVPGLMVAVCLSACRLRSGC